MISAMGENGSAPKRRINWAAARAYWLALPPEQRLFVKVAERFGVSPARVGQVARRDDWLKAAADLEQEEERVEMAEIRKVVTARARSRGERLAKTLEIYDRANDLGLELLPLGEDGEIDLAAIAESPSLEQMLGRLPRLFRMAELAAGEATDRVTIAEIQPILVALGRVAIRNCLPERRSEVVRELEEATAGLLALPAPEAEDEAA